MYVSRHDTAPDSEMYDCEASIRVMRLVDTKTKLTYLKNAHEFLSHNDQDDADEHIDSLETQCELKGDIGPNNNLHSRMGVSILS